jgi:hypothetical protein
MVIIHHSKAGISVWRSAGKTKGAIESFYTLGKQCKDVSPAVCQPFISPWIDGKKAVMAAQSGILV